MPPWPGTFAVTGAGESATTLAGAMLGAPTRARAATAVFADARGDTPLTHADMVEQARRLASGLAALGLVAGDIVAVQMPTRPATMVIHAALAWAGLVVLPIIHIYEGAELGFVLRESGAKAIITPDSWRAVDFAGRRAWLAEAFPQLIRIVDGAGGEGEVALASLLAQPPHAAPAAVAADDPAMVIYTSGTTSRPKGVRHSHASLLAELTVDAIARGQLLTLAPWPPGHVAGVLGLLRFAAMGQASIYLDAWDAHVAARLIEQYRVEATSGTPFHITTLLDAAADGRDISSLRDYMAGATMIPPALIDRCEALGLATYRCYGLSEHPTISCGSPTDPLAKRLGTDGRLNPGVEVRLVDDDGRDVPQGQPGEIWSRGPDRFIGYHDPSRDAEAFTADGWLRTGDVGVLDAEGFLAITDRKKDIIIRGGENIASREVEDILSTMPGVREAAVVGAPDAALGERVAAFILAEPGADLSLAAVASHFAASRVARQKTPEIVRLVDELPRNTAGKVLKAPLRAMLASAPDLPQNKTSKT